MVCVLGLARAQPVLGSWQVDPGVRVQHCTAAHALHAQSQISSQPWSCPLVLSCAITELSTLSLLCLLPANEVGAFVSYCRFLALALNTNQRAPIADRHRITQAHEP